MYPPGGTLGPRVQGYYQLVVLHSGSLRLTIDDQDHQFVPGTLIWLRPGWNEFFRFSTEEVTWHSWIDYFGEPDPKWAERLEELPLSLRLNEYSERILQHALRLRAGQSDTAREIIWSLAYQLLLLSLEEAGGKPDEPPGFHEAIQRVTYFIGERLGEELSLRDLAQAAAVSAEHLCRLFKKAGYPPPMEWLWHTRTQHGLMLLRSTGLSVAEVARQCGFKSPFHFSRRVKQATDMTPTQYRLT